MVQSNKIFTKTYYLCITNIEIVQNSKSKPKNSHSCVPLTQRGVVTFACGWGGGGQGGPNSDHWTESLALCILCAMHERSERSVKHVVFVFHILRSRGGIGFWGDTIRLYGVYTVQSTESLTDRLNFYYSYSYRIWYSEEETQTQKCIVHTTYRVDHVHCTLYMCMYRVATGIPQITGDLVQPWTMYNCSKNIYEI